MRTGIILLLLFRNMPLVRGVHSGDRVGFRRVSFDSIVFWIHVATSHTRVGSVNHGLVEDRLFELSG